MVFSTSDLATWRTGTAGWDPNDAPLPKPWKMRVFSSNGCFSSRIRMLARLELRLYGRRLDALIAEKMQRAPKEIRSFYGVSRSWSFWNRNESQYPVGVCVRWCMCLVWTERWETSRAQSLRGSCGLGAYCISIVISYDMSAWNHDSRILNHPVPVQNHPNMMLKNDVPIT